MTVKESKQNKMEKVCECCTVEVSGANYYQGTIDTVSNGLESYKILCNACLSSWFIECPDDLLKINMELIK